MYIELPVDTVRALYTGATVAPAILLVWIWQYRDRIGAKPLLVVFIGGLIFSGSELLITLVDSRIIWMVAHRMVYVGQVVSVTGLFVFALEYTGRERWIRPWTLGLLGFEPVLAVAFVFINPNNLFFTDISTVGSPLYWVIGRGIAFWIHAAYSYLLLLAASILIFDLLHRYRSIYWGQAAALLIGILLPWILSLAYLLGLVQFDSTPIGIAGTSVLFGIAITRYRFIDIVPIARDRVVDEIRDVVLVIDSDERVIEANDATKSLLDQSSSSITGQPLSEVFSSFPKVVDLFRDMVAEGAEQTFEMSIGVEDFKGRLSPIEDGRGRHVGWLIVAHIVTEQKRRERELRREKERLDEFASVVSHDLRNPLNVAQGRVDLAREECDTEHLDPAAEGIKRSLELIEDMLDLASAGQEVSDTEPVEVANFVDACWETVETHDATVVADLELTIRADKTRLRQLFENLFRNAVEHGGEDVTVRIGSLPTGFYVEDDGPGISEDEREDVWESGYSETEEGTGLGLSIVKQIVEAHGWDIKITEGAEGGARFEITGVDLVDE